MRNAWIFDLDGTLVDSLPGIAASLNFALCACGCRTHDAAAVRGFIGDGAEMLVRRAVGHDDAVMQERVLAQFREHYAAHWHEGTVPYEGIVPLLHDLHQRGHLLAVLSNKPHPFTAEIVERLFPGVFAVVLGQRPGIPHKPDPTGLREILQSLTWSAARAAMIGDSVMDLQTAHAAGIDAVAVTWGYHDRPALLAAQPAVLCEDIAELTRWMIQSE